MLVLADIGVLPAGAAGHGCDMGGERRRAAALRGPTPCRRAGRADPRRRCAKAAARSAARSSWETPQALQAFPETSPFAGLAPDPAVKVTRQVLAEPDADLPGKVWATLEDGTPLVTAAKRGKGIIVLFHVTANADWSNLPISGLFVEMLRRVLDLAPAAAAALPWRRPRPMRRPSRPAARLTASASWQTPRPTCSPFRRSAIDKATRHRRNTRRPLSARPAGTRPQHHPHRRCAETHRRTSRRRDPPAR